MTKTTKIFAGLGVATALGVAALPALTSFAADKQFVTGNVDLYVNVPEAIAMTIEGNNDSNSIAGTDNANGAVDVFNPASAASTTLDGHSIPATATTKNSSSAVELTPKKVQEGGDFKSTIKVFTNAATGYTLTVIDADETTDLAVDGKTDKQYKIPAITADADGGLTAGTAAWGYRVGTSGKWLAMPASTGTAANIGSKDTPTSGGDEYIVEYGVSTASDQAAGTYSNTIKYTATVQ